MPSSVQSSSQAQAARSFSRSLLSTPCRPGRMRPGRDSARRTCFPENVCEVWEIESSHRPANRVQLSQRQLVGYFVIPSKARNPGLRWRMQKPRSLTSFGTTKAGQFRIPTWSCSTPSDALPDNPRPSSRPIPSLRFFETRKRMFAATDSRPAGTGCAVHR